MSPQRKREMEQRVVREFEDARLGDARLEERLASSALAVAGRPSRSFPAIFRSEAALEGFYRLLRNERLGAADIVQSHVECSVERVRGQPLVLAVHDESECVFKGEGRQGLGEVSNGARGFFVRASLALSADGSRTPLGLLGLGTFVRPKQPSLTPAQAVARSRRRPTEEKETDWWRRAALAVQERLVPHTPVVHVMDREADIYGLLAALHQQEARFVIRAKHNRWLEAQVPLKLQEALWQVQGVAFRQVPLSRRRRVNRRGAHPARSERTAQLHVAALPVVLPRPADCPAPLSQLPLNVVHVYEVNTPEGQTPIEWVLLTSEPITTCEELERIVDFYRARWPVEEFFKALKTGCAYQQRQLESFTTLSNALALLAPIAWLLLLLRSLVQTCPDAPASTLFSQQQLHLLRSLSERVQLPANPSVRHALLALAGLGGHLKRNGDPGWQTLAAGFSDFLAAERGWLAANRAKM